MARREWAEREARKRLHPSEFDEYSCTYENALKYEHARAVRIVKRLQKNAERGGFGLAYGAALKDVLTALQKGRA